MDRRWWVALGVGAGTLLIWRIAKAGETRMHTGLDVSHHQGVIDWRLVARSGYEFAFIKSSEGGDWVDDQLVPNGFGARSERMKVGYYHFARPDNADSDNWVARARLEAGNFLDSIATVPGPQTLRFDTRRTAAVWMDLEKDKDDDLTKPECLSWVLEMLAIVEQRYPCGLYTSDRWMQRNVISSHIDEERLLNRPDGSQRAFWTARYGNNSGYPEPEYDANEKVSSAWGTWDIWQYTSQGSVAGIDGRVDLNLSRF